MPIVSSISLNGLGNEAYELPAPLFSLRIAAVWNILDGWLKKLHRGFRRFCQFRKRCGIKHRFCGKVRFNEYALADPHGAMGAQSAALVEGAFGAGGDCGLFGALWR